MPAQQAPTILSIFPSKCFTQLSCGVLILILLLCGGCIPVNQRSNSPIKLSPIFSESGDIPLQDRWWLGFQDTDLTSLIDQALTDNFTLQLALERLKESEALARQTGAFLLPSLDGRASGSSTRNHNSHKSVENVLLGFAASYELDLWGRLRNQRDAAILENKATEADYQTALISLTAEVANTWYSLVETALQLELLAQQKETNTKVLELISSQFRSGKIGIADVLQQRQLLESNTSAEARLRADARVLEHQLAILLGRLPGETEIPKRLQLPTLPPLPKTGIPLDLITKRPDITSSYLKLTAIDHRVAAAMADRLPTLSLSADLSTSGGSSRDLFNNWLTSLGANLFAPLFDGGRRRAIVARNESLAQQQFYRHAQTILEAMVEVENGLAREKEQQVILASLATQLQYATETIEHVSNRYRQGVEDYQRVLQALLSHQGLQRTIITSRRQLIQFRISLCRALSGPIPAQKLPSEETEIHEIN